MGLISWFNSKIDTKTMDDCDNELWILQDFIGDKTERVEHFAESFFEAIKLVSNLCLTRGSEENSYSAAITIRMTEMRSLSRIDYNKDIISRRVDFKKMDPVRGSAYKILATWLSLVEIRSTSKNGALRAHNLILAYEKEVTRLLKVIDPVTREAIPIA